MNVTCQITGADGLPVELMGFTVEREEAAIDESRGDGAGKVYAMAAGT